MAKNAPSQFFGIIMCGQCPLDTQKTPILCWQQCTLAKMASWQMALFGPKNAMAKEEMCIFLGVDACQGDSGGPASIASSGGRHTQVGEDWKEFPSKWSRLVSSASERAVPIPGSLLCTQGWPKYANMFNMFNMFIKYLLNNNKRQYYYCSVTRSSSKVMDWIRKVTANHTVWDSNCNKLWQWLWNKK